MTVIALRAIHLARLAGVAAAVLLAAPAGAQAPAGFEALPQQQPTTDPAPAPTPARKRPPHRRAAAAAVDVSSSDLVGRYAVMRDKRDTGCMVTLDTARVRGGARAQLAPGCRDQGIVIFDPTAWQVVDGELVLTARAGHRTRLERSGVGVWQKVAKEGGKPLGLKRL